MNWKNRYGTDVITIKTGRFSAVTGKGGHSVEKGDLSLLTPRQRKRVVKKENRLKGRDDG